MSSSTANFQLFPPPLPKLKISSSTKQKPVKNVDFLAAPGSEAVVLRVNTDSAGISTAEQAAPRPLSFLPNSEQELLTLSTRDEVNDARGPSPIPQSVRSASATLVRGNSANSAATSPTSPFVPMRSLFPVYNQSLPLSQQPYYPASRITNVQSQISREEYGPKSISPRKSDFEIGGPRTRPGSVVDFPTDGTTFRDTSFSSARELAILWEATSGQEPSLTHSAFDLQMTRHDVATFNFGSAHTTPFYTLQTYNTNEISISRTHPRNHTCNIPIQLLALEDRARRQAPNDGLVTYMFPKLAEKLAMFQSTELATLHGLAPTHRDEIQADAIRRAAAQEACHLKWNESGRRYELGHPAIGRNPRRPDFSISPVSPRPAEPAVLHIHVSSDEVSSPLSSVNSPPVIFVTNPYPNSALQSSMPPDPRMSNLPLSDNNDPLASLDLGSMTLHISARSILQLMPSLYAIDSIVSAIFAVAVADEATNPILADLKIWTAPAMPRAGPASAYGGSIGGRTYQGSVLYTTIAEREEAEQEAKLMEQVRGTKQAKAGGSSSKPSKSFWTRKSKSQQKKRKQKEPTPTQIVIDEIDLEKLGHYQSGDRKGQKLPAVTRSVLTILVFGLELFVWFLTVLVKFLSWFLVTLTRAVTSDKF